MTNPRSTPRNTHWLMIAGLAIAGLAMNVACSSGNSNPADSGAGGSKADGGGAGGSGTGGMVVHVLSYTFDTDAQGWMFSNYPDPNSKNLTGAYPVDAGSGSGADGSADGSAAADAGPVDAGPPAGAPMLAWDGTIGQPNPGSLKISVTFTDCNQYVDPSINLASPKNLTGKMLHGRLQTTTGTFSGGAQLHVTTGSDFAYQAGQFNIAPTGTFGLATLDLTNPTGTVNPAQVVGVGVQIYSGSVCPYPNAGTPVVFNLDTITD